MRIAAPIAVESGDIAGCIYIDLSLLWTENDRAAAPRAANIVHGFADFVATPTITIAQRTRARASQANTARWLPYRIETFAPPSTLTMCHPMCHKDDIARSWVRFIAQLVKRLLSRRPRGAHAELSSLLRSLRMLCICLWCVFARNFCRCSRLAAKSNHHIARGAMRS